jgi:hypothetical protein
LGPDSSAGCALVETDVVNLGYVLNMIETLDEQAATLRRAWTLCRHVLAVSTPVVVPRRGREPVAYADGVLTSRHTF